MKWKNVGLLGLAISLLAALFAPTEASIVGFDFETSEGYPETTGSGGSMWLYDHGWDCTSAWYVPYTTMSSSAFANTGARSVEVVAEKNEQRWASHEAAWTPTETETLAIYSSAIAFQQYPYGTLGSVCYGGIALQGKTANSNTEQSLGGIQMRVDGTATTWSYPGGTYTSVASPSAFTFSLNHWYQLQMWANFANNTVQFYLDGNSMGTLAFNSDLVELSSIALYTGSTSSWSIANVRYDTVNLVVPEPTTVGLMLLGGLAAMRRKRR